MKRGKFRNTDIKRETDKVERSQFRNRAAPEPPPAPTPPPSSAAQPTMDWANQTAPTADSITARSVTINASDLDRHTISPEQSLRLDGRVRQPRITARDLQSIANRTARDDAPSFDFNPGRALDTIRGERLRAQARERAGPPPTMVRRIRLTETGETYIIQHPVLGYIDESILRRNEAVTMRSHRTDSIPVRRLTFEFTGDVHAALAAAAGQMAQHEQDGVSSTHAGRETAMDTARRQLGRNEFYHSRTIRHTDERIVHESVTTSGAGVFYLVLWVLQDSVHYLLGDLGRNVITSRNILRIQSGREQEAILSARMDAVLAIPL